MSAGAVTASASSFPVAVKAAPDEVVFYFISDVHACRMNSGLSPNCQLEGKTNQNLLRHIAALNALPQKIWPAGINGNATGLELAGKSIGVPRGVVVGGDMTDDGGGQTIDPTEGTQLLQFSQRYSEGPGPDRVHFPVYAGLGNHDLDQDGPQPHVDWYRQEMRDYIEVNHEPDIAFKPPVPAQNFDPLSDCYSWDWGGVHFVQLHRFGGDTRKGAVSALPWMKADLLANAKDRKPVVLFQHYGWDRFSTERWDAAKVTFDDSGSGAPHWWAPEEQQDLLSAIAGANVIAIFHGHEHDTPMIYRNGDIDLIKPVAAFKGGFAVARITNSKLEVALGQADGQEGDVIFTNALSRSLV